MHASDGNGYYTIIGVVNQLTSRMVLYKKYTAGKFKAGTKNILNYGHCIEIRVGPDFNKDTFIGHWQTDTSKTKRFYFFFSF